MSLARMPRALRLLRAALAGLVLLHGVTTRADPSVLAAEARFADAATRNDSRSLGELLTEDFFYNPSSGSTVARSQWLASFDAGTLRVHEIRQEQVRVLARGDTALVTGIEHVSALTRGAEHQMHQRFLHVWRRDGAHWRLAARQATTLP